MPMLFFRFNGKESESSARSRCFVQRVIDKALSVPKRGSPYKTLKLQSGYKNWKYYDNCNMADGRCSAAGPRRA
jgi:hypothetical protein